MLYLQYFLKSSSSFPQGTEEENISFFPFVYTVHFRAGCAVSITAWITFNCCTLILCPEEGHMHRLSSTLQEDVYQLKQLRVEAEQAVSCKAHREEGGWTNKPRNMQLSSSPLHSTLRQRRGAELPLT